MKQFEVIFPQTKMPLQAIGKVVRKSLKTPTARYAIQMYGIHRSFLLCSEEDARRGTRIFQYKADPCLHEGDVLEFTEGTCIIHFSSASNDNCLLVSNGCNERCINCPQLDRTRNPLLSERNAQIIALLPGDVHTIALSGGEPTVDFPVLLQVIKRLYAHHPSIHIDILTNGITLADYDKATELSNILKQETSTFCITLYGDIPAIHDTHTRVAGSFAKLHTALHHLAYYGYTIEMRYLITKMNYDRLPSFIEYVYDNFPFVDHVSLMGMEVSGDAAINAEQVFVPCETYIPFLLVALQKAVMRDVPVFIYNHPVCLLPRQLWRFAVATISDWKTGYSKLCEECDLKGYCGGFFTTSNPKYIPTNISPISLNYSVEEVSV